MSGEPRNPEERPAPSLIERINDRADLPRADLTPRHTLHPSLHHTVLLNYATNANLSLPATHFRVFLLDCWLKQTPPPTPIATLAQSCLIPLPFFLR